MKKQRIILASSSKFRIKAFKNLGFDYLSVPSNFDEKGSNRPSDPVKLVKFLARSKAQSVLNDFSEEIVIGFDTIGLYNNKILEKVTSKNEVKKRLLTLSGKTMSLLTGIYLINLQNSHEVSDCVETKFYMRKYSEKEVLKYLAQDDNTTLYAISFAPGGLYSCTFIEKIEGSYNNLTKGIPLERIVDLLKKVGFKIY